MKSSTRLVLVGLFLGMVFLLIAAAPRQDRELQQPPPVIPVAVDSASAISCYFIPITRTIQCVGWGYRK